jgi:hypothetical protein
MRTTKFNPTDEQIQYIKDNWRIGMSRQEKAEMCAKLNCNYQQIQWARIKHKLQLTAAERLAIITRVFSEEDIAYIKANLFRGDGIEIANEVAKRFNMKGSSLIKSMQDKGIKRETRPKKEEEKKQVRYKPGDRMRVVTNGIEYIKEWVAPKKIKVVERITPYKHKPHKKGIPPAGTLILRKRNGQPREYIADGKGGMRVKVRKTGYKVKPHFRRTKPRVPKEPKQRKPPLKLRDVKPRKKKPKKVVISRIVEERTYINPVQVKTDPPPMRIKLDNFETHRYVNVAKGVTILVPYGKTDEQAIAEHTAKKAQAMNDLKNKNKKVKRKSEIMI